MAFIGMYLYLSVSVSMICGYDNTGPHIFFVDNDGSRIPGKLFSVGSGSTYALGVLDAEYREDMTKIQVHSRIEKH